MSTSPDPKLAAAIDAAVVRAKRIQAAMDNEAVTAVVNIRVPQAPARRHTADDDRRYLEHMRRIAPAFAEMAARDSMLSIADRL